MHPNLLGRLAGLGLAVAWLCTSAPPLVAQAPPPVAGTPGALRVFLPDAGTPVTDRVTVRFSEPMVAEPGGNPGALDFLHLSPDVPVRLQWQGTDTLAITPAAGGFPIGRPVTLRIAAGARALSGARLPSDVSTAFTARPVSATMEGRRRASDRRVVLVIRPDRELSPAMAKALLADIHYQPYVLAEIAPSVETRDELARRDPRTLARIEASQRAAAASAAVSRRVVVRPVAGPPTPPEGRWLEGLFVAPNDLVVETIDVPPPDVRLIVGAPVAANASEPKVAPWEPRTRSRLVRIVDTLRLLPTRCGTSCAADDIGLQATLPIDARILQGALRVVDITDPAAEQVLSPAPIPPASYPATSFALTSLGYSNLRSGRRYRLSAETGLKASGGQAIAEPWVDVLTTALREPLAVVGNRRDAVWEAGLGPRLPVVARSLKTVEAGAAAIAVADLPTALSRIARSGEWAGAPKPALTSIPIAGSDDTVRTPLVDVSSALGPNGRGFVWLVAKAGTELPRSDERITVYPPATLPSAVLVQVTNLGVTVRTLGDSVLVFVTTLDTGVPVAAANVTILDDRAQPLWRGATDAQGVARTDVGGESVAAGAPSLVLVEHGGDRAFGEPITSWDMNPWLGPSKNEALEAVVFTDRGVYRPGESVHVKAILRRRAANHIVPLAPGTPIALTLDRGSDRLATLDGRVGAGGGVEWTVPIAADVELSSGYVFTVHPGTPEPPSPYQRPSRLSARVAIKEVRPLEFEVEAAMTRGPQGGTASEPLGSIDVRIAARDLTGVPLRSGRVSWRLLHIQAAPFKEPTGYEGFDFAPEWSSGNEREPVSGEGRLEGGAFATRVQVPAGLKGLGYFALDAEVVDGDTAQAVSTTLTTVIHPEAYLGLAPDAGTEAAPRASVRVVALGPDGRPVAGVPITLVARSQLPEGRPLPPVHVVSGPEPIEVHLSGLEASLRWTVEASGSARERIVAPADAYAQVATPGLTPSTAAVGVSFDKPRYAVGDRARITVRPPWTTGSTLVTIERHRIVSHHVRPLDGRPIVLDVPIDEEAVGGLSVSAIVVKGRTGACCGDNGADPGAPAVAMLDERIVVDPASARLQVAVEALTPKPGPGAATRWRVGVTEAAGRPVRAEVALWAVDEGWLRLTDFVLPDVAATLLERDLPSIHEWDSRRALLRRTIPDAWGMEVQTDTATLSSAEREVLGDGRVRIDRRPVAFWFGDLRTGDDGSVTVDAPPLPETLTTYRVFAVAATPSRFGQATQPLVVTSPVMLRPSPPRFLTRGDRATIPIVVASLQDTATRGRLTIESLTPDLLAIDGEAPAIALAPGERRTISIGVRAIGAGQARLRVRIVTANAADAVEHAFPIVAPVVIERTVVSGPIDKTAQAVIAVPRAGIDPAGGGLTVSVSASLLAGVSLAGEDLEAYAYLCLEQRTSRMLALALAAKEGGPFAFVPVRDRDPVRALQQALRELPGFRCAGEDAKGYGLWNGACRVSSPYLSAYLLYALQTIRDMAIPGVEVDEAEIDRAADAVEAALRAPVPATGGHLSEGWAALGLKALADEGRYPAAAGATMLARREQLPLWAIAHLYDALLRADPGRPEQQELESRLLAAITTAGVTAQVVTPTTESPDWTWPSHGKTTAIVLDVLARHGKVSKAQARALATGLMQQRRADGGWVSTQENAWALIALATYRHEVEGRDDATVAATADLDGARLIEAELCGEHDPATRDVSMRDLQARLGGATQAALTFTATGDRPAFFTARLEVQRPAAGQPAVSHGIAVTRRYELRRGETWVPVTSVTAGDVVRVTVTLRTDQSRFLVALSDPLPAGFESIDPELASTSEALRPQSQRWSWWGRVFDHVQRRDGRIDAFVTMLPAHETTFEHHVRATTAGTFFAAPPHAGQMYEPEVYGRGTGETIVVKPAP